MGHFAKRQIIKKNDFFILLHGLFTLKADRFLLYILLVLVYIADSACLVIEIR